MFQQLTTYLFQHRQVAIPQVGVFQLVQNPAALDYANRIIQPPTYTVQFLGKGDAGSLQEHSFNENERLLEFGQKLKNKLQKGDLNWSGIGSFEYNNGHIKFHPNVITVDAFGAVDATKILRENVQHNVLRGETQVMQSIKDMDDEVIQPMEKNSYTILVGWILVIILFAFIIYMFVTSVTTN